MTPVPYHIQVRIERLSAFIENRQIYEHDVASHAAPSWMDCPDRRCVAAREVLAL